MAHGFLDGQSEAPLIGASGAVAGIIGAYLMLHPKVWVWILAMGRIPLRMPDGIIFLFWIGLQIFMVFAMAEDSVSWAAHIGGFFAGALIVLVLRRRGLPLFDREIVTPAAVEFEEGVSPKLSRDISSGPWGRG